MGAMLIADKNNRKHMFRGGILADSDLRRMVSSKLTWLVANRWTGSQAELATVAGVYQTHISNMLSGKKLPSAAVLSKLADALETNTDFILGRTTDDKPASDLEDQIVLGVEDPIRRHFLQAICDCLSGLPDGDLKIFLEIARRFNGSQDVAARNREELWTELWATVSMLGGDDLVRAFRRAMDVGSGRRGRRGGFPVADEDTKQMN